MSLGSYSRALGRRVEFFPRVSPFSSLRVFFLAVAATLAGCGGPPTTRPREPVADLRDLKQDCLAYLEPVPLFDNPTP